jgi:hypothetical protein
MKRRKTMTQDAMQTEALKLEDLIAKAKYKQHPYGQSWQPFDAATFKELVADVDRRGLDKEIVLYQDMVLDGWHRYLERRHTVIRDRVWGSLWATTRASTSGETPDRSPLSPNSSGQARLRQRWPGAEETFTRPSAAAGPASG